MHVQVTGVGSLPHSARSAVRPPPPGVVPWLVELPATEPGMVARVLDPLTPWVSPAGEGRWEVADRRRLLRHLADAPLPLPPGVEALRELPGPRVKIQQVGPATVATALTVDGRPAWTDEALGRALALRCAGQLLACATALGRPVTAWLDEPWLGGPQQADEDPRDRLTALAIEALRRAGLHTGVHCCAFLHPRRAWALNPHLLSFDAFRDLEDWLAFEPALAWAATRETAWGLVPTWPHRPSEVPASALLTRWRWALQTVGTPLLRRRAGARAWVTTSCGLAGLPEDEVGVALARCLELARGIEAHTSCING